MNEEKAKQGGKERKGILGTSFSFEEESFNNWKGRICLLGPSGGGKTQSIETFPQYYKGQKKPVLVISYDGRYQTLLGVPGIEIINLFDPDPTSPQAWIKTKKLTGELWSLAKDFPYSLIVEDNMTLMGRYAMNWALLLDPKTGLGGSPAQQHYSPQMKAFSDHILSMKELPCHYIVTGHHEYLEVSAEGQVYLLPKVIGKTARTELASWFDETYWVNRKDGQNKKTDYYWITKGNGSQDFFKSTLNKKGVYWDDPVEVDLSKKDTGFRYILKKRFKEIPE